MNEIIEAARNANIHSFIDSLPEVSNDVSLKNIWSVSLHVSN